jgi:hypothetical protein
MENLAPNGKKSNLNTEQYELVRTTAFKKWFGDWENDPENSSKVVDENGEPLVVYHGTNVKEQFNIFDFDKADLGFHFGTYQQANDRSETKIGIKGYKKIITSYFLNIRKLFSITDIGEFEYPQRYFNELLSDNLITEKEAKENGFFNAYYKEDNKIIRDFLVKKYKNIGFEYNNQYEGKGKSFITLNNNQMKLADGSNTTFDAQNPDIRYKVGGSLSKTPSPSKDRIYGSKINNEGSAASKNSAKNIELSSSVTKTLKNKRDEYNAKHPNNKVSLATLKAVFRRGAGAYSTSHRPNITRSGWAYARVNKFLLKKGGAKVKAAYVQDDDLMKRGAILNSSCKTYISQNESVLKTGYYLNLSDFSSMVDPYGQIPLNLTHTLVTYNSGNQDGLSLIDTINPINLQNELADILNISINKSQVVVGLYIEMGKKLKSISQIEGDDIIIIDRDKLVCKSEKDDNIMERGGLIAPNLKPSNLTPEHEYKKSNLIIMNQNEVIYDSNDKYAKGGKIPNDLRELPYFDKGYEGAEYYSFSEDEEDRQKSDRWFELIFKHQKERIKLTKAELEEFKNLSYQLEIEDYEGGGEIEEDKVIIYHEKQGGMIKDVNGFLKYTIDKENNEIIIDNIKVDVQRRGTGKKMINVIKELSRELDIPITLYAEPQDESINDDELREFYLSQGFDYHPDDVNNKYFVWGN